MERQKDFKRLMVKAGECMDRMIRCGYPERESWLCMTIANALYFMCLNIRRIDGIEKPAEKERVDFFCNQALQALYDACCKYADAPEAAAMEGVLEGMRAIHTFERAKQSFQFSLKEAQADSESSTSKSD